MNFNEYQEKAKSFAVYPDNNSKNEREIAYTMLGLMGETGEVAEKIKKMIRGDTAYQDMEKMQDMLTLEIGDILWYLTNLCTVFDIDLDDVAIANITKLTSRKERGVVKGDGDDR